MKARQKGSDAAFLMFLLGCSQAFVPLYPRHSHSQTLSRSQHASSPLFQSSTSTDNNNNEAAETPLDVALARGRLGDAVRVLREQTTMELSRNQWNSIFDCIQEQTANNLNDDETEFSLQASRARQDMTDMYQLLLDKQQLALFGAIGSEFAPVAGSHTLPPRLLESALNLPMEALTPQPTNTLLIAGGLVAALEIGLGSALHVPLPAFVLGSMLAATADRVFLNGAAFETFAKLASPGMQSKIVRHEAAHFLLAYLLGCPVEGVVTSAWAARQDKRFGARQVSAATSFYDPVLSQQMNTSGRVTRQAIDRYSIIVMAGIAAEAEAYGRADGGSGDEAALVAFLSQLNGGRAGGGQQVWSSESIRNQARWGALQAVLTLREYKPAYEALVEALERGGSLGDCVWAIEKAARDNNLTALSEPLGYLIEDDDGLPMYSKSKPLKVRKETPAIDTYRKVITEAERPREFQVEELLQRLKLYRVEAENKLKTIDDKLKSLDA
jgi:hypothetical protein